MPRRLVGLDRARLDDLVRGFLGFPIGGPNSPAMRLDDLARDRQSEAGILTKALVRPIRVEPLEYALERVRRYSWTIVVDRDDYLVFWRLAVRGSRAPRERDPHETAPFGERACVVDQIRHDLRQTRIVSEHEIVGVGAPAAPRRN